MLGCTVACRRIRRLIQAIEPAGQWGSPAGGRQCDIGEKNGCVYPLLLRGAVSPACAAAGLSFRSSRGSGGEHPRLFRKESESSGSVAREISIARVVSHPEQDLRAEHLALRGEAFAQGNLGLRLKASTGQVWRIVATNALPGIQG